MKYRMGWVRVAVLLLLAALAVLYWRSGIGEQLSFDVLKENRAAVQRYVAAHYPLSVALFMAACISTAFFVPGAIALTLLGGFLFGAAEAVIYVDFAATTGAALAFLLSRYLVGGWIQERFRGRLARFNSEMERYGGHYLLALRVVPVMPFAAVNYLAGITTMSLKKFVLLTSIGTLPGAVIYCYAGRRLAEIGNPKDIFSPGFIALFVLAAVFALLPVALRRSHEARKK